MKIVTIIGARPQFIKAAVVSREINSFNKNAPNQISEILVHTGQHYDENMSQIFFDEMEIPRPNYNLAIGSGNHGQQTASMLTEIEKVLLTEKPDLVVVYGDTNSTIAGSLAASKLHIPIAHVEAGLRSYNRKMPEEINRILTDHCSSILLCPTQKAIDNLKDEGLPNSQLPNVELLHSGDVMNDAAIFYAKKANSQEWLAKNQLTSKKYFLATIHRAESTDNEEKLEKILKTLEKIGKMHFPVVWPMHPRTKNFMKNSQKLSKWLTKSSSGLKLISPLGYLDMVVAEKNSRLILTDSGGVQKEAFFHSVPCVTMRTETEWVELVESGWNKIVGLLPDSILKGFEEMFNKDISQLKKPDFYGSGTAGKRIVKAIVEYLEKGQK